MRNAQLVQFFEVEKGVQVNNGYILFIRHRSKRVDGIYLYGARNGTTIEAKAVHRITAEEITIKRFRNIRNVYIFRDLISK